MYGGESRLVRVQSAGNYYNIMVNFGNVILTTALSENRTVPNRKLRFFFKTEPKPTDLGQCEATTTLVFNVDNENL